MKGYCCYITFQASCASVTGTIYLSLSPATDLMKLKKIHNTKKRAGGTETEKKTESVLSALTPGLCFDFHPTVSLTEFQNMNRMLLVGLISVDTFIQCVCQTSGS